MHTLLFAPATGARPARLLRHSAGACHGRYACRPMGDSVRSVAHAHSELPPRSRSSRSRWHGWVARLAGVLLVALTSPAVMAQPASCSSDGVPVPAMLRERFLSADCADCWRDAATPGAEPGVLALDWVLPGAQGDEAPLSAVARPEAAQRLAQLGLALSGSTAHRDAPVQAATRRTLGRKPPAHRLRVVQGQALGGYLGVEIRYDTPKRAVTPLTAGLAMVEALPKGIEGSPVARNMVRNLHTPAWNGEGLLSKTKKTPLLDLRAMNIPEGANPANLRLIGWIEDAKGRVLDVALTDCGR
ncbi:MAG: hypothetical protein Fur0019_04560 [Tibeticola sp.]